MKKGFSLVEIIISVGLIAIVMLFLFQILTDLQYEESTSNYASSNQLNRANIIQKVEEDFNTRFVKRISLKQNEDGSSTIYFTFEDNTASVLTITQDTISYKNSSLSDGNNLFAYKMEDNSFKYSNDIKITSDLVSGEANYVNLFCEEEDSNCGTSQFHYVKIRIPVINIKEEGNNIQDDIELFYVGPFVEYANKYKRFTLVTSATNSTLTVTRTETQREEEKLEGTIKELQNGDNIYEKDKIEISASPTTGYENVKIRLNNNEITNGSTYTVKDNEQDGIVTITSTASLKEFGISLTGNNELPIIIERTSTNKAGATTGTINASDKIYYGDKIKVRFDTYNTAKYENLKLKINNTDYTPGNEITIDRALVINRIATVRSYVQTIQTRFQNADGTWGNYTTVSNQARKYGETVTYSVAANSTYAAASITSYQVTGTKTVKLDIPRRTSTNIIQVRYQNADGSYGSYSNVVNGSYRVGQTVSWSREADATYNAASSSFVATASNQTKQVSITRRTYALTINKGTGIQSVSGAGTYRAGQTVNISANLSNGYNFNGWTKTAGTIANTSAASTTFTMPTSAATVTANGVAKTYTVSYNANGGTGGPGNQTKTHDKDLKLSSTKPSRTGYTFKEWNTKSNGSGTSYSSGGTYKTNAAVTLYAQWSITDNNPPVVKCVVPTSIRTGSVRFSSSMFSCSDGESGIGKIQYYSESQRKYVDFADFDTTSSGVDLLVYDNAGNKTYETCYTGVDNVGPWAPRLIINDTLSQSSVTAVTCVAGTSYYGRDECTITVKRNMTFRYYMDIDFDRNSASRTCDAQEIDISCAGYDSTTENIYSQNGTLLKTQTVRSTHYPITNTFPIYNYSSNHYRIVTSKDKIGNVSSESLRLNIVYE